MKQDDNEVVLLKSLLSQPSFEQARAVLTASAEELTDGFFNLIGAVASGLGQERKFDDADYVASIGVEAARISSRKREEYIFIEVRGLIAVDAGDVEKAVSQFSGALDAATKVLEGGDRMALSGVISASLNLAHLEATRGNFEEARAILSRARVLCHALNSRVGELWAIANLASTCQAQGDNENALGYASLLMQLYGEAPAEGADGLTLPDKASLYEMLIRVTWAFYYDQEDYEKTATAAKLAIKLEQEDGRAYAFLGFSQLRLKQFDDAVATWSKLVAQDPNKAFHHNNHANALYAAGRVTEAIAAMGEAIRLLPNDQRYYTARARMNESAGLYEDAIQDYKQVVRLYEGTAGETAPEAREYKSQAEYVREMPADDMAELARLAITRLYIALNRPEEAQSEISNLIIEGDEGTKAVAHFNRGNLQQSQGNFEAAIDSYSAAIELMPEHTEAHVFKADAHLSLGQLEQAVSELAFVARRDRNTQLATEKLKKIVELHPDNYTALKWLGYAYFEQYHPSKVEETLTLALKTGREESDVHLWRGLARIMLDVHDEEEAWNDAFSIQRVFGAFDDMSAAVRLAPGSVEAVETLKWLVDRITTDGRILFMLTEYGDSENGLFGVLPDLKSPLEAYHRATALSVQRKWGEAVKLLKDAQQQLREQGFPLFAIRIDVHLADNYLRLYELQKALDHLAEADKFPTTLMQPLTASLRPRAQEMTEKSRAQSFREAANLEIDYLPVYTIGFEPFNSFLTILKAQTYARTGDRERAVETLKDVEEYFKDVAQTRSSGVSFQALVGIVTILRDAGQLERALELLLRLEAGPLSDHESMILNNTAGTIREVAGDMEGALTYFQKAYDIAVATSHEDFLFGLAVNLAATYTHTGRAEEALKVLQQVDVEKSASSENDAYFYFAQMAQTLETLGRYAEAQEAILRALDIAEAGRSRLRAFDTRMNWHADREPVYRMAISIAFANSDGRTAFSLTERVKARAFVDQLAAGHLPLPAAAAALEKAEQNLSEQRDLLTRLADSVEKRGAGFIDYELLRRLKMTDDSLNVTETSEGGRVSLAKDKVEEELSKVKNNLDRLLSRKEDMRLEGNEQTHGAVLSFDELRETLRLAPTAAG